MFSTNFKKNKNLKLKEMCLRVETNCYTVYYLFIVFEHLNFVNHKINPASAD